MQLTKMVILMLHIINYSRFLSVQVPMLLSPLPAAFHIPSTSASFPTSVSLYLNASLFKTSNFCCSPLPFPLCHIPFLLCLPSCLSPSPTSSPPPLPISPRCLSISISLSLVSARCKCF